MKRINVVSVNMVKEKSMMYNFKQIHNSYDAFEIIKNFIGDTDREHFVVACLDTKHNINALHTVSVGTLDQTLVAPREVFKIAILANSSCIIVAHNHPSGDSKPSKADIAMAKLLCEAGGILGINVLDSIIVGDTCLSMKSNNMI